MLLKQLFLNVSFFYNNKHSSIFHTLDCCREELRNAFKIMSIEKYFKKV